MYSENPDKEASLRQSIREGMYFSVMFGGAETYFVAFALLLGASTLDVAWLTSVPVLIGSFAQLLGVRLSRAFRSRPHFLGWGASMQALIWPLLLVTAFLQDSGVLVLTALVTLYYATGAMLTPIWGSLMGDLVAESWRGRYFARRNQFVTIITFAALVAGGAVLHATDAWARPLYGFAVIFMVAMLARLRSAAMLGTMLEPAPEQHGLRLDLLGALKERRALHFSLVNVAIQFAVFSCAPFFTVYMLRDIGFSYLEYTALIAANTLVQFFTLRYWGLLSDHYGNRLLLTSTALLLPVVPFLWLWSDNFWYLLLLQAFGGWIWCGVALALTNLVYDLTPQRYRTSFMAMHGVLANIGICTGVIAGGALAANVPAFTAAFDINYDASPLLVVFAFSAVLRLLVALWLVPAIQEVREVRQRPHVLRVVRLFPGFVAEAVWRSRKR